MGCCHHFNWNTPYGAPKLCPYLAVYVMSLHTFSCTACTRHISIVWNAAWGNSLTTHRSSYVTTTYVTLLNVISPQCLFCHWPCGRKKMIKCTHPTIMLSNVILCLYIFHMIYVIIIDDHILIISCIILQFFISGECANKSRQGVEVRSLEYANPCGLQELDFEELSRTMRYHSFKNTI